MQVFRFHLIKLCSSDTSNWLLSNGKLNTEKSLELLNLNTSGEVIEENISEKVAVGSRVSLLKMATV